MVPIRASQLLFRRQQLSRLCCFDQLPWVRLPSGLAIVSRTFGMRSAVDKTLAARWSLNIGSNRTQDNLSWALFLCILT